MIRASKAKNDEFYTRYEDVERIVRAFADHLRGKRLYCNCDTEDSAFVQYLLQHADELEYDSLDWSFVSFDDPENLEKLDACDIVITNPPFSMYSHYLDVLDEHGAEYILVAPQASLGNNWSLSRFLDGSLFYTRIQVNRFIRPDGSLANVGCWIITSFGDMDLYEEPRPVEDGFTGRMYDNYDAIECGKLAFLPFMPDDVVIGVPATIMTSPLRLDYDIVGRSYSDCYIGNKNFFKRVFVKRKPV